VPTGSRLWVDLARADSNMKEPAVTMFPEPSLKAREPGPHDLLITPPHSFHPSPACVWA
jgi:hypothetical protein